MVQPDPVVDNAKWWHYAACAGLSHLFFPGRGESTAAALEVCNACPVRRQCLEDSMATPGIFDQGVKAGLSERQRRKLRALSNKQGKVA